jgi:hypothetical protein
MRVYELIAEGTPGKITKRQQNPTRGLNKYTDADKWNSDYKAYRLGVAMAATDGVTPPDMDEESWIGRYKTLHPYSQCDQDIINMAAKVAGVKIHDTNNGDMRSQEMPDTYKVSPVSNWNNKTNRLDSKKISESASVGSVGAGYSGDGGVAEDVSDDFDFELDTNKDRLTVYSKTAGALEPAAGRVEFFAPDDSKPNVIEISYITVWSKYQKQGLATAMWEYLKQAGYKIITPTELTSDGKGLIKSLKTKGLAENHKKDQGAKSTPAFNFDRDEYTESLEQSLQTILIEKAESKAQQKFMGMVHAAQKGKKPASKEVSKVAKTMSKADAKDYASTKHTGLPKKKK